MHLISCFPLLPPFAAYPIGCAVMYQIILGRSQEGKATDFDSVILKVRFFPTDPYVPVAKLEERCGLKNHWRNPCLFKSGQGHQYADIVQW